MIPKQDSAFIAYCRFFTEEIRANQTAWGVRDALFNALSKANDAAQAAWLKHTDASSSGKQSTYIKDSTFAFARKRINFMHDLLRASDDLVSDVDLKRLGISPREAHAREPVPAIVVSTDLTVERPSSYTFIAVTKELEYSNQRQRTIRNMRLHPKIVVRYCYLPVETIVPVNREELPWHTNQAVGHAKTTINATGKAGLKLVVQSAFHNNSGTGPWSKPFEIIVS